MNRKTISEPSPSLDRQRGSMGALASRRSRQDNEIDWNRLLLGKKSLSDQEIADDAPRNSLESSPGTRTPRFSGVRLDDIPYAVEVPKPTIPPHYGRAGEFYYNRVGELCKRRSCTTSTAVEVLPIKTLIAQDSSDAELERKRRSAPSVVARLMGLDALPEKLSRGSPAKPPKPSRSAKGSRTETKPHSLKAESSSSRPPSPLHDVDTIKDFPLPKNRAQNDSEAYDEKTKFDVLPFRAHPQERQLQEFKKEFMEKLANSQRYAPTTTIPLSTAKGDNVDAKDNTRKTLREKLSEAKLALESGGEESRRLSSAQAKLMESKEFQDAIELLQTNKEFFKKFFPGYSSNSLPLACSNKDPPEPENISRRSFHLDDLCHEPPRYEDTSRRSFHLGDFSRDSRKSCFLDDPSTKESSRRSFHLGDAPKESRRNSFFHHPHESPKDSSGRRSFLIEDHSSRDSKRSQSQCVDDVTKEIRAVEDYSDFRLGDHQTDSRGYSSSDGQQHPHDRSKWRELKCRSPGSNPVAEELAGFHMSSAKPISMDQESVSWVSPSASPEANMNSGKERHGTSDSKKGCDSPSRIVVLKPGPGEITVLTPATDPSCSPNAYRIARDARGATFDSREVVLLDPSDRFSPPMLEEPSSRYTREEYRDPRVDPRAIARDIVREARTNSTRELSRDRETGRESPRHPNSVPRNGGSPSGKRVSLPKYGYGVLESTEDTTPATDETMGSFTLAALSKRHAIEEKSRSTWPIVPIPSPGSRFQESATGYDRFMPKEGKFRRTEKSKAVFHMEHIEDQHRKALTDVKRTMGQAHELNRAPMISRPRTYLPGIKSPTRARQEPFLESAIRSDEGFPDTKNSFISVAASCLGSVPNTEKILGVQPRSAIHGSNNNNQENWGEESSSQDTSPRMAARAKCLPNAGAILGPKTRSSSDAFLAKSRYGSNSTNGNDNISAGPEWMESSEHYYLKEKRAEARQAFLFSRKVTVGSDLSPREISSRLESNQSRATEQSGSVTPAIQDVHVDRSGSSGMTTQPQNIALLRSSFENAVPIGGSRNVDRTCEHTLRVDMSQQRVQDHSNNKNISEGRRRQISGHKLEASVVKRNAKGSEGWSIAPESLDHGDVDGASETSVDKCGQPSPVSVLDSPFEAAEVNSPVEFKEFRPDLQDPRLRLPLLKLDGSDLSITLLEGSQIKDKLNSKNLVRHTENCLESTESASASSSITSTSYSIYRESHCPPRSQTKPQFRDNCDIEGLPCPEGRQEELIYVRNILVASGFTEGATVIMARWHSPTCPLGPQIFEKLEDYYVEAELQVALEHGNVVKSSNSFISGGKDSFYRRLLFDVVNEVLLHMLSPYLRYDYESHAPRHSRALLRPVPTHRQLVSATWLQVCTNFLPRGVEDLDALDCLMYRDVSKSAPWVDSQGFADQIGLELERTIFESLIEDTVHSFGLPRKCLQDEH